MSMHAALETQRGWKRIYNASVTASRKLLPPVRTRTLEATPPQYSKVHLRNQTFIGVLNWLLLVKE